MATKYTSFHCKTPPKLIQNRDFWSEKYSVWQPWIAARGGKTFLSPLRSSKRWEMEKVYFSELKKMTTESIFITVFFRAKWFFRKIFREISSVHMWVFKPKSAEFSTSPYFLGVNFRGKIRELRGSRCGKSAGKIRKKSAEKGTKNQLNKLTYICQN
jgi:hypothetical protein